MNFMLKNGTVLYHTPDSDIVSQFESGVALCTIVARLASHDRISKTVARRRVHTAILRSQLNPFLVGKTP